MPNGKALGDYIPFYFGVRMPMLYVVQHGFNGVKSTLAEDIIYCVTSVEKIISENIDFVFTNGHAVNSFSNFYFRSDIEQIENIIDLKAIKCKYWKDDNDLDIKRRKEAEFLIAGDLPISAINGYIAYNEAAKVKLLEFGINEKQIGVVPGSYF